MHLHHSGASSSRSSTNNSSGSSTNVNNTSNFASSLLNKKKLKNCDYSPVHWSEYFDEAHDLNIDGSTNVEQTEDKSQDAANLISQAGETTSFRIYLKNFHEPFAPDNRSGAHQLELSAAQLAEYSRWPTVVTLHGGGYSALTWSLFASHLTSLCRCRLLSIDLRAHGDTKTANDEQTDADTLVNDILEVTKAAHRLCGLPELPKLVLVGHSMGGALAIKLASQADERVPSIIGLVVIDVVEGTAKDALPLMLSVIKTRPARFPSLTNAIEWCVRSGMAKSIDAARVSMPGNLINLANGQLAIHDIKPCREGIRTSHLRRNTFNLKLDQLFASSNALFTQHSSKSRPPSFQHSRVTTLREEVLPPIRQSLAQGADISEELSKQTAQYDDMGVICEEESKGCLKPPDFDQLTGYTWRTDLARTQPHWAGWFEGLSAQMLSANVPAKFLLLAGIDRLDKTLTIGQMQGKFMMKVLPKCGHAVHEDLPEQVALAVADFLVRNKFTS